MSLQERRNEQTRAEIYAAAAQLFVKNGVENTSVSDIATAADVSRRTVYRHFRTKEDIVYEVPRRWLNHYCQLVADRWSNETDIELCHRAVVDVGRFIQSDRAGARLALQFISTMPSFTTTESSLNRSWLEAHRAVLSASLQPDDMAGGLRASLMAGALVGGTDAILYHWFLNPKTDLVELTEQVWSSVEKIQV